jgi:hypothetical protein
MEMLMGAQLLHLVLKVTVSVYFVCRVGHVHPWWFGWFIHWGAWDSVSF